MAQPENWMQGESPASDTCDPPLRDDQQRAQRTNRPGGVRSARRMRSAHLHSSALSDCVLDDVVPHLLRSFGHKAGQAASTDNAFDTDTVREFTHAILDPDESVSQRMLDEIRAEGATAEELYLGLFSDTARLLGYYWENDRSPFTEVTLALWRLHRLVREISPEFRRDGNVGGGSTGLRALLTTAPGEQHSFGLLLVSEWFGRAGWTILPGPFDTDRDIGRAVAAESVAIVGFSLGSETHLDRLAASIVTVRRKSRNPDIGIMVGGSLFNARPELVARIGADVTARDATEALALAQRFAVSRQWAPM